MARCDACGRSYSGSHKCGPFQPGGALTLLLLGLANLAYYLAGLWSRSRLGFALVVVGGISALGGLADVFFGSHWGYFWLASGLAAMGFGVAEAGDLERPDSVPSVLLSGAGALASLWRREPIGCSMLVGGAFATFYTALEVLTRSPGDRSYDLIQWVLTGQAWPYLALAASCAVLVAGLVRSFKGRLENRVEAERGDGP